MNNDYIQELMSGLDPADVMLDRPYPSEPERGSRGKGRAKKRERANFLPKLNGSDYETVGKSQSVVRSKA